MKKIRIAIGQVYELESGEAYEILDVTEAIVKLKTSDGEFVVADVDEVVDSIQAGGFTLHEDVE